jgi:hypothetical protein
VSAAPISDRRLDLAAGDATRIGLYLGKEISRSCRRRRPCAKDPASNQASPDRFTIAVTMACRIVQGSHYSRASLIGRQSAIGWQWSPAPPILVTGRSRK